MRPLRFLAKSGRLSAQQESSVDCSLGWEQNSQCTTEPNEIVSSDLLLSSRFELFKTISKRKKVVHYRVCELKNVFGVSL